MIDRYTHPGFLGAIGDIDGKVNCFYQTAECIDGDDEYFTRLDVGVKNPKHCTEERCHIGN